MLEYTAGGVSNAVHIMLAGKGFQVGKYVGLKEGDQEKLWKIHEIYEEGVKLREILENGELSSTIVKSKFETFQSKYALKNHKAVGYEDFVPIHTSEDIRIASVQGYINIAMAVLCKKYGAPNLEIKKVQGGDKRPCAAQKIEKGKLKLVPAALEVAHVASVADLPPNAFSVKVEFEGVDRVFQLKPIHGKDFVSPAFQVKFSHEASEVNCKLEYVKPFKKGWADGEFELPLITNTKRLQLHEVLVLKAEAKRSTPAPKKRPILEISTTFEGK